MTKGHLQEFLDAEDPDILCFNEIKTDDEKLVERRIKEHIPKRYKQFWHCCKSRKGYSGTAIISKVQPIDFRWGLGHHEDDQEGRSLTLEFNNFVIVAVYTPNSG